MAYSQTIQELIGFTAPKLFKEFEAECILVVESQDSNFIDKDSEQIKIVSMKKGANLEEIFFVKFDQGTNLQDRIKAILIEASKIKIVQAESRVVLVFDKILSNNFAMGMLVVDVSRILYRIGRFDLGEFTQNDLVVSRVIEIAEAIREEGREGKKVGTIFVIGDKEELEPYFKQLVLNPFHGYPENIRDITTKEVDETIKEFSQLDGAFFVTNSGIVESAGTYIDIDTTGVKKFDGWGTRHLAAVAITQKTNAISVLVSESGAKVKVFKNGKLMLKF